MAYTVRIQTGQGRNRTVTQSISLSNKEKVRNWIKRNPVGNINTNITIKNTLTKRIEKMKKMKGYLYGINLKKEIIEMKNKRKK